ncbi:MAG TPA: hypothetical protein VFQ57_05015 [Sphingomonas sp.]|jgi:hypothetical protein|nr:hypothetical protein [Sphingomonas sp.]
MTIDLAGMLRHVRALWTRDRAILLPLSGLFMFLPQYGALLLIPPMPASEPNGSVQAWTAALEPWVATYGGWYVLATLSGQFGALAVVSLYAHPPLTTGGALLRALRLFARVMLANILVTLPCGAVALASMPLSFAPFFVLPAIVYVLARTMLIAPVIVGEPRTSAIAAIGRSVALTKGRGMPLALLVGAIMVGGQAMGTLIIAIDRAVRIGPFGNRVLIATIDGLAAGVAWAAALLLALVHVAVYRRLAR